MYLNAGCGNIRYPDTINMDTSDSEYTDVDVVGSILDIPFEDGHFDGVICNHVLEHLPVTLHANAVKEFHRVTKMGGHLYIAVPDFVQCMQNYLDNYRGQKEYWYKTIYGRCLYEGDEHKAGIELSYLENLFFMFGYKNLKSEVTPKDTACISVLGEKGIPEVWEI